MINISNIQEIEDLEAPSIWSCLDPVEPRLISSGYILMLSSHLNLVLLNGLPHLFYVYNHVYFPRLPQACHILSFWIAFGHESTPVSTLQPPLTSFLHSTLSSGQGYTNSDRQVAVATKFFTGMPWCHPYGAQNIGRLLDLSKNYAPLP